MKILDKNPLDKYGSEYEQARKVILDGSINMVKLSKLTKIPYATIREYRSRPQKLVNASWKNINRLARIYIISVIEAEFPEEDQVKFVQKLSKQFDEWKMDAVKKHQKVATVEKMEELVLSDPLAVTELYNASK